jgi:hypothetical protein
MQNIQGKHWQSKVSQDPYLSEVFLQPPLTVFRRLRNLKDRGMKKCGKNCTDCPYIKEVKSLYINQKEWKINQSLNCDIFNCIYFIACKKDNCDIK